MKFIKVKSPLPVNNLDLEMIQNTPNKKRHGSLLPNSIRCIIAGPSNCGKTNLIISLITNENGLHFENIYLYSKSLFQPKYEFLKEVFKNLTYRLFSLQ